MSNKHKKIVGSESSANGPLLNIGHHNYIIVERILAIIESSPLPSKRLREQAAKENRLIDATAGRKMRSLIITDSNHVFISALIPQTLHERLRGERHWPTRAQLELREGEFVS